MFNKTMQKRYPVNANSFYEEFKKISIKDCIEIIKTNLCLQFNKKKAYKYLIQEKKRNVWEKISKTFKKIREILYYYFIYCNIM